jgi:ankyrin repeat protein
MDNGDPKEISDIAKKLHNDKFSLNPILLLTTWKDDLDTMTITLQMGADPNARDHEWRTCLHLAANNDSVPAVKLLLEYKVILFSYLGISNRWNSSY